MFYFTVYSVESRKASPSMVSRCLSYDSENGARAYQQALLGKASQLGATIEKQDEYYFITGKITFSWYGLAPSKYNNYYMIGIETDDNVSAKATEEFDKSYIWDGLEFERRCRNIQARKEQEAKKENETIDKHLADFTAEIENKDLKETLKILIKYSQYVRGKHRDRLLDIAVDKLQGNTKAAGWYDELSNINN